MHSNKLTAWSLPDARQMSPLWMTELDLQADYSDSSCAQICVDVAVYCTAQLVADVFPHKDDYAW